MPTTKLLLCLFVAINVLDAEKILCVFPSAAYSHHRVFSRFTKELAKRGHEVVVITPFPDHEGELDNLKEINISNETLSLWRNTVSSVYGKHQYLRMRMKNCLIVQRIALERILQNSEVKKIITDKVKFDLLVLEGWVRPIRSFAHVFKAPVIIFTSLTAYLDENHIIGSSTHPTLYPLPFQHSIETKTLLEQIGILSVGFNAYSIHNGMENEENEVLRRYFSDSPALRELNSYIDVLFLNAHWIWDQNRPVPPSAVYGGAIQIEPERELPKDLETYLNASVHGVIYVSFGTNVMPSAMPSASIQVMVRVLSMMQYDVLWKWDEEELPGRGANIKFAKWFPQADLLRHPKIKLFVTQCGLQSTDEAIAAGVPLLGLPLIGDQWFNAENYIKHKIGAKVELDTITEDEFRDAIETVIGDKSYRSNIKRFGALLRDSPQSPMERIMWWTEHVLLYGAGHLRAPAHNMHWTQYLEIELLAIVLICVSLCFIILSTCIYYLIQFISSAIIIKVINTIIRIKQN